MEREVYFNFSHGLWLLFLLIPLLLTQLYLMKYRKEKLLSFAQPSILPYLLTPRSSIIYFTKIGGSLLIWSFATAALMEPFGNVRYNQESNQSTEAEKPFSARFIPHQIIFLVDTSASMRVPDGTDGNTRLDEAKAIMEDIMRQLNGQTASVYAFTSELSAVVPPTVDYLFTRLSMKDLRIDEGDIGGTRFAPSLKSLKEEAFPQPSDQRFSVIMFSDGGDNELETLKGEARDLEKQNILKAIPNPKDLHLQLFTIGLGSLEPQVIPHVTSDGKPVDSKLEADILKELAAKERGKYYEASKWTTWNLAEDLKREWGEDTLVKSNQPSIKGQASGPNPEEAVVDWYFQVPLGLALMFYMIYFILPDARRT